MLVKLVALLILQQLSIAFPGSKVFSSCCNGCGYSFTSNDELRQAVNEFRSDAITAAYKYGIMNCWDVHLITNMSFVFDNYSSNDTLNDPIDCWDVSGVTDMFAMFSFATTFNQPLNSWDISCVTNMSCMFLYSSSFNQPLNSWFLQPTFK